MIPKAATTTLTIIAPATTRRTFAAREARGSHFSAMLRAAIRGQTTPAISIAPIHNTQNGQTAQLRTSRDKLAANSAATTTSIGTQSRTASAIIVGHLFMIQGFAPSYVSPHSGQMLLPLSRPRSE